LLKPVEMIFGQTKMANSFLEMENIVPPHTTVLVKRIADGFKMLISME